ncbi:hypothetical protein GCM10023322_06990 [Rugosimonospora acidiphila]|uniref:Uncharacterized protein n=1 Tax=Rugosimonospora acidiphila TaxID=556531 RepID=A0ABP9RKZ0_9ACTN
MLETGTDEFADHRVVVIAEGPGHPDLAGADTRDGPVGDPGTLVEAGGGLRGEADTITAGDGRQPLIRIVRDGTDADLMTVSFVRGQPVVTPPAGLRRSGDEGLVP